jgi:3-phenylpropionate/trans-cinnamate dioxygenase ferredoxin reductase subunit
VKPDRQTSGIVIVGAGQAGASLAIKLRSLDYHGAITLIGDEPYFPYQRPPLSKGYLLGEVGLERLYLRAPSFWESQNITLMLGKRVAAIDSRSKLLTIEGDEPLAYDQLALTTGARCRTLPAAIGGGLANVFTIRTLSDVDALGSVLHKDGRVLILGGGYIGLEAAAVTAKLDLRVTLVELAPRILQRVAARQTSDYFRILHRGRGVTIMAGVGLDRLTGDASVSGAILSDGREVAADLVIVGIGIEPNTSLALSSGLVVDNGISTDEFGRTSGEAIWAAGDCASFPHAGRRIRLESVGNAIEHAETVAENMLGACKAYHARPWFWSDQYDVKLQIAGLNAGYDHVVTRAGAGGSLSVWYFRDERLLAVDAINDARAYMVGKRLIDAGRSPDAAAVADPTVDLKTLLG